METQALEKPTDYQEMANLFLERYGIKFRAKYLDHDFYFPGDKERRDIYRITLSRKGRPNLVSRFGQSIINSGSNTPPTAYDFLASITKYDPESFEDFCSNFGYSTDSISGLKTYRAVVREWQKVSKFFNDYEMTELQEIN